MTLEFFYDKQQDSGPEARRVRDSGQIVRCDCLTNPCKMRPAKHDGPSDKGLLPRAPVSHLASLTGQGRVGQCSAVQCCNGSRKRRESEIDLSEKEPTEGHQPEKQLRQGPFHLAKIPRESQSQSRASFVSDATKWTSNTDTKLTDKSVLNPVRHLALPCTLVRYRYHHNILEWCELWIRVKDHLIAMGTTREWDKEIPKLQIIFIYTAQVGVPYRISNENNFYTYTMERVRKARE